eukprot:Gregarina_sp_Poly_1__2379@NODE_1638_length_3652_cov_71_030126_g1080_i0_p2_GENE_NODE_1638_length_3652_cov_71_030126_g1080_i0NODE_1638_length_3652_cov_71_030126_g1080_i0_p2_ORF_typecomplete_len332_score30_08Metallophos/PF00149_28/0_019DBR1/PF05011_13/0_05_NODE_1638_length_3652_cov_71_030126_g1080_i023993394
MKVSNNVAIALQGCIHGEMNSSFDNVRAIQEEGKWTVPCLLWSGDVQTVRDANDLEALACPPKFRALKDFHEYYNGEKVAPCLTLFIGGNHEASGFLYPLWFGGWVAPRIFYLGRSGVVTLRNFRIAGLSGIFKAQDYYRGYDEELPFNSSTMRSVYHVRNIEVKRLLMLKGPVSLMLTHDWPTGIVQEEKARRALLRKKPFFEQDLTNGCLGNPSTNEILEKLKPPLWVAAHLHVNFKCNYTHDGTNKTEFYSHDKPKRYVSTSIVDIDSRFVHFCYEPEPVDRMKKRKTMTPKEHEEEILIDLEWLLILKLSWANISTEKQSSCCMFSQ